MVGVTEEADADVVAGAAAVEDDGFFDVNTSSSDVGDLTVLDVVSDVMTGIIPDGELSSTVSELESSSSSSIHDSIGCLCRSALCWISDSSLILSVLVLDVLEACF